MESLTKHIKRILWRGLYPCKENVRLISLERDGRISLYDKIQVRVHLLVCTWCQKYVRQLELLNESLQQGDPTPGQLDPDIAKRLKKTIHEHS